MTKVKMLGASRKAYHASCMNLDTRDILDRTLEETILEDEGSLPLQRSVSMQTINSVQTDTAMKHKRKRWKALRSALVGTNHFVDDGCCVMNGVEYDEPIRKMKII